MNQSYLSYQQNDFFWTTVQEDFDFSICDQFRDENPTQKPPNMLSGMMQQDPSSCNCPTLTPPTTRVTPNIDTSNTKITISPIKNENIDEYTKQVCINYLKSNALSSLNNTTSASQSNFSDYNDKYNRLLLKTLNVTIGIIAIAITIGFS